MRDLERLPEAVRRHELARMPPAERALIATGDSDASERAMRALFWTFVYHLEPQRWDELARYEPIPAPLLEELPPHVEVALDVGAGSGRLTGHLCTRARRVVAVEPSLPLSRMLARRLPSVDVVAGWADSLPLPSRCAQLTASCASVGPDAPVLSELERVTARRGSIVLINPEQPEWFAKHGWTRTTVVPPPPDAHPQWIDGFFGPPAPPSEVLTRRLG